MLVPYFYQWQPGATTRQNDCGQTCTAMLLAALGIDVVIDSLRVGDPTGLTTAQDLVKLFTAHGVNAHVEKPADLDNVPPNSIILVSYAPIAPYAQDIRFKGLHWMVWLGNGLVHDPDYWGMRSTEGANKRYPIAALKTAYKGTAVVMDGLMPLPEPRIIHGKAYRVVSPVNFRQWYSVSADRIGSLDAGQVVIGYDRTHKDDKYLWRMVEHGGNTGWAVDSYLTPVT